uniref:Uncharacterized protein n=1 Tax=Amblyomma tuberculatum TaxID=48802 RepID=A0A6M2E394_9ACAR
MPSLFSLAFFRFFFAPDGSQLSQLPASVGHQEHPLCARCWIGKIMCCQHEGISKGVSRAVRSFVPAGFSWRHRDCAAYNQSQQPCFRTKVARSGKRKDYCFVFYVESTTCLPKTSEVLKSALCTACSHTGRSFP